MAPKHVLPRKLLLAVIAPLLSYGIATHLRGGIAAARNHPLLRTLITSSSSSSTGSEGLFHLDTQTAARLNPLPQLERPTPSPPFAPLSPLLAVATHSIADILIDTSPSPPPNRLGFRKLPQKRPSVPNLGRIDTSSTERLNGHIRIVAVNAATDGAPSQAGNLRKVPSRAATLSIPPVHGSLQPPPSPSLPPRSPRSPIHLSLTYSNHSPTASHSQPHTPSPTSSSNSSFLPPPSPTWQTSSPSSLNPPATPRTSSVDFPPPSPSTARPEDVSAPPTTDEAFPVFTVSTILPNFLYLGPEVTLPEHVDALRELGVKRILNIAAECDDDHGLHLRETFEKYVRIPMRDIVEEENIARGVREVCEILDDARLHSAPTYVHCKAGKSRSVTAVMAYLIHANHWTLSQAYSFVHERRKGISPNIGFVSELMTFEESELGGKSIGVQPNTSAGGGGAGGTGGGGGGAGGGGEHAHGEHDSQHHHDGAGKHGNYGVAVGNRRLGHVRESLPPVFQMPDNYAPMSAGGVASIGDSGQEMEIKDASGRYRHARRAPVDENTLQPLRRVSKAGLESSGYTSG